MTLSSLDDAEQREAELLRGGIGFFQSGGGSGDGAVGLMGEELCEGFAAEFGGDFLSRRDRARTEVAGAGEHLQGHRRGAAAGFRIGDDALEHGGLDAKLELHEQFDGFGFQSAVGEVEQRVETRLNERGEGFGIARGVFMRVAVDAVETRRSVEDEQEV
ncbi:MAG: hypothetical protein IPK32_08790 [Verrucomicrobiaceae bacterium]|nr:hypothetical protein [Verrucomicrobiaceae bacterium]